MCSLYVPGGVAGLGGTLTLTPTLPTQLEAVVECIEKYQLVENARITGEFLQAGLRELETKFPQAIANVRGQGTLVAFDAADPAAQARPYP